MLLQDSFQQREVLAVESKEYAREVTFVRYHSADVARGPRSPNMNRTAYVISAEHGIANLVFNRHVSSCLNPCQMVRPLMHVLALSFFTHSWQVPR